ncbi:putative IQ motif and ankyrin repeat domain-containing protein [Dendronephthya gigantea]|uniref:putative IQ motif and ankyrin repeat domain-containing protein n=1 Tax=Dendronephthya gigantea TaxID=151771 RepID=UPI00106CB965|nr:putative IQ motif and ankyrin repeat domain-containing protein [Dendronephthya gigantea]
MEQEDDQARIIQTAARKYLARKRVQKLKKDKQDYEELMVKLEKEAWLQMVEREREEEEKERQKEQEERKKKAQEMKWRKRLLEAAFDGDDEEINCVLNEALANDKKQENIPETVRELHIKKHQLSLSDCEDANGNTPLSEASAGGHASTIQLLLHKGVEINSRGRYERTPLWRAAFAGHLQAVQLLLENGGDPRLHASDGTSPVQVAAIAVVEEFLKAWDVQRTDELLKKLEENKEQKLEEEQAQQKQECDRLEKKLHEAEKEDKACQMRLEKAHCELNKRIFEHDKCVAMGDEKKIKITLQTVHDAELELETAKQNSKVARDKLAQLKLRLREQRKEGVGNTGGEDASELVGIKVSIKELDDVLMRDVGGKIAQSGRWPLLIDSSTQTSTFLRYRDTNFLNALNPSNMEPDVIRLAILGAVRFGKPLVLDMMAVDMFESVKIKFDVVQEGLLNTIMTKEILKDDRFMSLVRAEDGEQYSKTAFLGAKIENFKFIILTQLWNPSENLINQTYPLRVMMPSKS